METSASQDSFMLASMTAKALHLLRPRYKLHKMIATRHADTELGGSSKTVAEEWYSFTRDVWTTKLISTIDTQNMRGLADRGM